MKIAEKISAVNTVAEKAFAAQSIAEKAFGPINRLASQLENIGGVASIAQMHQTNELIAGTSAIGKHICLPLIYHKLN